MVLWLFLNHESADPNGVIRRVGALFALFTPPVVLPMGPEKPHLAPTPTPTQKCQIHLGPFLLHILVEMQYFLFYVSYHDISHTDIV